MKAKLLFSSAVLGIALLMSGCVNNLTNLTPPNLPQNSSGIYTITSKVKITETNYVLGSEKCSIVIDGIARPMVVSNYSKGIYTYDYAIPSGQNQARYYYVLEYDVRNRGVITHREVKSPLQTLYLANRYVLNMETDRGIVGSKISILGRGFARNDTVVIGGVTAPTEFVASNVLTFTVPAIPANQDYFVELHTATGDLPVGKFHVDPGILKVSPASLNLISGQKAIIVFSSEFDAPEGGLLIDVLTNVPESVVMPPVVIPAGQRSVSVKVQGGKPGVGQINLAAPGFNPMVIPVSVTQ